MPSAPEARKNKPTNKWISNHKGGGESEEHLKYVRKLHLSAQFLCSWAFSVCDNPTCILGNMLVFKALISLDLCLLFFFSDQARCKKAWVGWFSVQHCWLYTMHHSPKAFCISAINIKENTPFLLDYAHAARVECFFFILQRSHLEILEIAS